MADEAVLNCAYCDKEILDHNDLMIAMVPQSSLAMLFHRGCLDILHSRAYDVEGMLGGR